uniref:glycogenin-2-like n=1 Tax=Monopterus albus TaxID=43700 RepID=UPI0009B48A93|nr:glycogenin-2-like [Monopterus albus]
MKKLLSSIQLISKSSFVSWAASQLARASQLRYLCSGSPASTPSCLGLSSHTSAATSSLTLHFVSLTPILLTLTLSCAHSPGLEFGRSASTARVTTSESNRAERIEAQSSAFISLGRSKHLIFPPSISGEAFVTMATTDSYCMGATVVARSLQRHGMTRNIVVMVTPNVSQQSRLALESVFDEVIVVNVMDSEDHLHLSLLGRPELGITFTKIHCWTLTQYSKCVFLDADTLVLCNVDELFERDELSAAPDPGWPDCFNSGVFVFRPSLHTHSRLLDYALQHGSFDGNLRIAMMLFYKCM